MHNVVILGMSGPFVLCTAEHIHVQCRTGHHGGCSEKLDSILSHGLVCGCSVGVEHYIQQVSLADFHIKLVHHLCHLGSQLNSLLFGVRSTVPAIPCIIHYLGQLSGMVGIVIHTCIQPYQVSCTLGISLTAGVDLLEQVGEALKQSIFLGTGLYGRCISHGLTQAIAQLLRVVGVDHIVASPCIRLEFDGGIGTCHCLLDTLVHSL